MSYDSVVLADSPLAYWKLNDSSGTSCADFSGNGRNMTYTGSPTKGQAGLLVDDVVSGDTCVSFSGTGQYASMAAASWQNSASAYTVEVWFVANSLGAYAPVAQDSLTGGNNRRFMMLLGATGTVSINFMSGSSVFTATSADGAITTGKLFHVVGTYDGAHTTLYVNGLQVKQTATTGNLNTTSVVEPLYIASVHGGYFFPGKVEKVALYNTSLSLARVQAHYHAGMDNPAASSQGIRGAAVAAAAAVSSQGARGETTVAVGAVSSQGIRAATTVATAATSSQGVEGWASAAAIASSTQGARGAAEVLVAALSLQGFHGEATVGQISSGSTSRRRGVALLIPGRGASSLAPSRTVTQL